MLPILLYFIIIFIFISLMYIILNKYIIHYITLLIIDSHITISTISIFLLNITKLLPDIINVIMTDDEQFPYLIISLFGNIFLNISILLPILIIINIRNVRFESKFLIYRFLITIVILLCFLYIISIYYLYSISAILILIILFIIFFYFTNVNDSEFEISELPESANIDILNKFYVVFDYLCLKGNINIFNIIISSVVFSSIICLIIKSLKLNLTIYVICSITIFIILIDLISYLLFVRFFKRLYGFLMSFFIFFLLTSVINDILFTINKSLRISPYILYYLESNIVFLFADMLIMIYLSYNGYYLIAVISVLSQPIQSIFIQLFIFYILNVNVKGRLNRYINNVLFINSFGQLIYIIAIYTLLPQKYYKIAAFFALIMGLISINYLISLTM